MGSTLYVIHTSFVSPFIKLIQIEQSFTQKMCVTGQMCITIKLNCKTFSAHCRILCHSYFLSVTLDTQEMKSYIPDYALCINIHSLLIYVVLLIKMALKMENVSYFIQKF